MGDHTAFFYGTLMAPAVLHRVCHGPSNPTFTSQSTSYLKAVPAILHDHRRHRVRHADYPAVIPHSSSTVRGTYVTSLTSADLWRLDIFEGDEYTRQRVKIHLLKSEGADASNGAGNVEDGEELEAETYIWTAGEHRLEDQEWDFEAFKREKMRFWVGDEAQHEFAEVDEAVEKQGRDGGRADGTGGRGLNGSIGLALKEEQERGRLEVSEPARSAV